MSDDNRQGYTPFPPFAVWNSSEVSFHDVDAASARFANLKERVSREALDHALSTARRAAAVDTNAIEGVFTTDRGFTRTVAEKTGAWEQAMSNKGPHVRPAFEDALEGFELILDRMTRMQPVTEHFIRELHATLLRSQETHTVYVSINGVLTPQEQELTKGTYKQHANSPTRSDGTVHSYSPVDETGPEMSRLINELRSDEFDSAHPVSQAAYVHYAFVCIHPFADGNGRVARALASVYLYRSPGVPLVIYQDQRANYLDALEAADVGRFHTLMRFIAEQVTDTINLISDELAVPAHSSSAEALAELLAGNQIPERELNAAERLKALLQEALQSRAEIQMERLGLPFKTMRTLIGETPSTPDHYRGIDDQMATGLLVITKSPRKLTVTWPVALYAKISDDAVFDLVAVTGTGRQFGVYLRELAPEISEKLRQRAGFFADAVVEEFLERVARAVARADGSR